MKLFKYASVLMVSTLALSSYGGLLGGCSSGGSTAAKGGSSGHTGGSGGSNGGGSGNSAGSNGNNGGSGGSDSTNGGSGGNGGSAGSNPGGAGGDGGGTAGTGGTAGGTAGMTGGAGTTGTLIGYWKFDEGTGTAAADSSGSNNNATLVKGTTPTAAANPSPKWVAGKKGMAVEFNMTTPTAADEWANVPHSDSLDSTGANGAWTIAGWAKFEAVTNCAVCGAKTMVWNWVASRHITGTGNEYMGVGILDGKLSASVNFTFLSNPAAITVGAGADWVHVAATYDGITLTIYQAGTMVGSTAVGFPVSADTSEFVIGGNENDISGVNAIKEFMGGAIDELQLYNTALTADDIAKLAQ